MHDSGIVGSIGVPPKSKAVYTKPSPQVFWICVCHITYGMNTVLGQLGCSSSAAVDHFTAMQWPYLFFERGSLNFGNGIGFLHVTSEFGEDFVVRHANADGQTQLLSAGPADLFCDLHAAAVQLTAGYIKPTFIHSKRLHEVGVSLVDSLGHLRILQILIVMGRYYDQILAKLPSFPVHHSRLDTCLLGKIRLGEDDTMAILC